MLFCFELLFESVCAACMFCYCWFLGCSLFHCLYLRFWGGGGGAEEANQGGGGGWGDFDVVVVAST